MEKKLRIIGIVNNDLVLEEVYLDKERIYGDNLQKRSYSCLNILEPKIDGKTFYRYSDLTLSRDRVDVLKNKNNIKITRSKSKADYVIISKKYLQKFIRVHKTYITEVLYKKFNLILNGVKLSEDDLKEYGDEIYSVKEQPEFIDFFRKTYLVIPADICKEKYVLDTYLNDVCDSHLNVLNEKDFETVESLIKNHESRAVAIQMLANCNLNKSGDIIGYILLKYGGFLCTTKGYNHVNVKTMRKKFKRFLYPEWNIYQIPIALGIFAEEGLLTKFILNKLMSDFKEKVKYVTFLNGNIKLKQVEISDNITSKIVNLRPNAVEEIDV
jgi:hypothetical protein